MTEPAIHSFSLTRIGDFGGGTRVIARFGVTVAGITVKGLSLASDAGGTMRLLTSNSDGKGGSAFIADESLRATIIRLAGERYATVASEHADFIATIKARRDDEPVPQKELKCPAGSPAS